MSDTPDDRQQQRDSDGRERVEHIEQLKCALLLLFPARKRAAALAVINDLHRRIQEDTSEGEWQEGFRVGCLQGQC